jgi:hypothetical protein
MVNRRAAQRKPVGQRPVQVEQSEPDRPNVRVARSFKVETHRTNMGALLGLMVERMTT